MALNIKDPETERLAAEVAALTGTTKTGAVRYALRQVLEAQSRPSVRQREERLTRFLEEEIWPLIPPDQLGKPRVQGRTRGDPRLWRGRRMIIDSSAILAVIGKEPGYERIIHELAASPGTRIGAPTRLETGIVLTARFGPRGKTALARFLQENSIQTVAFDEGTCGRGARRLLPFRQGQASGCPEFRRLLHLCDRFHRRRKAAVHRERLRQTDLPLVSSDDGDDVG